MTAQDADRTAAAEGARAGAEQVAAPAVPLPASRRRGGVRALSRTRRWCWLALAYASLALGLVAIVIPGIPSTEFILLSAWAAAKGSPRLRRWLQRHRLFGPMIYNWKHGRVVARRAKLSASVAMSLCLLFMLWTVSQRWVVVVASLGLAAGALWMWSRPEQVSATRR